jgi:hypothetical protein
MSLDDYDECGRFRPSARVVARPTLLRYAARSLAGVVLVRPARGSNDDVIEASGRDPYDRDLGIAYDVKSAINISWSRAVVKGRPASRCSGLADPEDDPLGRRGRP